MKKYEVCIKGRDPFVIEADEVTINQGFFEFLLGSSGQVIAMVNCDEVVYQKEIIERKEYKRCDTCKVYPPLEA